MINYIQRFLESKFLSYIDQFPIVVVTGPRQAGKSTFLKHFLEQQKSWKYISLDQRGVLERIHTDPDLFVQDISSHIIIDEAQKAPALFHSIKYLVDSGTKYKFILSGSANFHLLSQVTETLAGRAGVLDLLPFSCDEVYRLPNSPTGIIEKILSSSSIETLQKSIDIPPLENTDLMNFILFGGYPKIQEYKDAVQKITWFENYRTTYLERDLRDLAQIADIGTFQQFYQILGFQIGNMLNLSTIANELGITVTTCKRYLHILESSYQYFLLQPFHSNLKKRLIKTPKIYITDTGLANFFMRNTNEEIMSQSGKFGSIFENFIISEFFKHNSLQLQKNAFYFWRTSNGAEIDLVIDKGLELIPIEIKASVQIQPQSIRGLVEFLSLNTDKKIPFGVVFYRGKEIFRIKENILALPVYLL